MKPDFWKELSLRFGDCCEVYDGTDNTTKGRSAPCIALHHCCNSTVQSKMQVDEQVYEKECSEEPRSNESAEILDKMGKREPALYESEKEYHYNDLEDEVDEVREVKMRQSDRLKKGARKLE